MPSWLFHRLIRNVGHAERYSLQGTKHMGVLIFEGMTVGILPGDFTISVDESGQMHSNLVLSTSYNVLPIMLRIAHDNIVLSHQAMKEIQENWDEDPSNQKVLLMKELVPLIQVFIASGISLDSLYGQLRPYANIQQADISAWKAKKTKRSSQILEVIRRVYKIDNDMTQAFKNNIDSIIEFRNKAVHPDNSIERSCTRPDIPVGVDWRFSAYRYENAAICYRRTMEMLIYLYEKQSGNAQVDDEMAHIFDALIELGLISNSAQQG